MFAFLFTLSLLSASLNAAIHPAKRQFNDLTITDVCGPGAVDCGSGFCCYVGNECIDNDPPLCRDLLISDLVMEAVDYSSFISLLDFDGLTSLGITPSTLPVTMTSGNIFSTGLPSYSDNVVSSITFRPTQASAVPSATSTGAAATHTMVNGWLAGALGAGMAFL